MERFVPTNSFDYTFLPHHAQLPQVTWDLPLCLLKCTSTSSLFTASTTQTKLLKFANFKTNCFSGRRRHVQILHCWLFIRFQCEGMYVIYIYKYHLVSNTHTHFIFSVFVVCSSVLHCKTDACASFENGAV